MSQRVLLPSFAVAVVVVAVATVRTHCHDMLMQMIDHDASAIFHL